MKLVYSESNTPVYVGDHVTVDETPYEIIYFREPHKPASSGKITIRPVSSPDDIGRELYVSSVGAEWIEREDQGGD